MINPEEILEDILRFRGFKKASWKNKLNWLLFYPFLLLFIVYHLILWIPALLISFVMKVINSAQKLINYFKRKSK